MERQEMLGALWDIYVASGADTDGDTGPGALIAGMGERGYVELVVSAVKELRDDYDAALEDMYGS